ncbi:MAG: DUF4105 domain-containing protein [Muribaculum sp.]|nr:DUF4105 domain-containing protein [Muribaculum sp.]
MQRFLLIFAFIFSLFCSVKAQERTDSAVCSNSDGGPLIVSMLTCAPGPDIYELCGHAALRIRNEKMDSVWNYGIFDFTAPNFVYRFCKGQTDYMVYGYDFSRFMPAYMRRGSTVTEQVLNLTQEEAENLRRKLQTEALPQNRIYRYNYVLDNCATRPWERVKESTTRKIVMPDSLYFTTFRKEMRYFHRNYPWYQFGIDLALGNGIDRPIGKDRDIFAPPILAAKLSEASIGGVPLVREENVIFRGYPDATLPPTPWYQTPTAIGLLMLLISMVSMFVSLGASVMSRYPACEKIIKIWISAYFLLCGIGGCVITFLVFCSEHEATSPNWIILWLNPLQLIPGVGVWFRRWRIPVAVMAVYDWFVGLYMFSVFVCRYFIPFSVYFSLAGQVANPAVLFMSLCLIPLASILLTKFPLRTPSVLPAKKNYVHL